MMKRTPLILLTALLLVFVTACGGNKSQTPDVDLEGFYGELEQEFGWESLIPTEGEMLETYYPGLGDLNTKQLIAVAPMMSAVVNEMVFLEAESEKEAIQAEAILQKRLDDQIAGGAWYPESIAAWEKGEVIREGTFVALIASNERQEEVAERFRALFE